jgi:hypothetical protein
MCELANVRMCGLKQPNLHIRTSANPQIIYLPFAAAT